MVNSVLSGVSGNLGSSLFAVQRTQQSISQITNQLSSGLRVSSALDNPQNFFASKSLLSRASDFARVIDSLSQSVRTIETAIVDAQPFYPAHEEHQAYLEKNPSGYCNHFYRMTEWPALN